MTAQETTKNDKTGSLDAESKEKVDTILARLVALEATLSQILALVRGQRSYRTT